MEARYFWFFPKSGFSRLSGEPDEMRAFCTTFFYDFVWSDKSVFSRILGYASVRPFLYFDPWVPTDFTLT